MYADKIVKSNAVFTGLDEAPFAGGVAIAGGKILAAGTEAELAEFAQNVQTAREYFASQGAEFVIYIAPDKERMYPEYLPDC